MPQPLRLTSKEIMKYIRQFCIIILFSFYGDILHKLLPLPIPASIYGMVLILISFATNRLQVESVKDTGNFLVSVLPLLFVAPTVGLLSCWELIRSEIWKIVLLVVVTTVFTFGVSGMLTKLLSKGGDHDA